MILFLLGLIIIFTRETQSVEIEDKVLGRKVPSIVFLQNSKLLKDAEKNEMANTALAKRSMHAQAQMNEYLFSMMRRSKIAVRMDVNIFTAFIIDLEKETLDTTTQSRGGSKVFTSNIMT